jgi:hypothetical protein
MKEMWLVRMFRTLQVQIYLKIKDIFRDGRQARVTIVMSFQNMFRHNDLQSVVDMHLPVAGLPSNQVKLAYVIYEEYFMSYINTTH